MTAISGVPSPMDARLPLRPLRSTFVAVFVAAITAGCLADGPDPVNPSGRLALPTIPATPSPRFGPWLVGRKFRNAGDMFVRYVAEKHVWQVGLTSFYPTRTRVATIDADSGVVVSVSGPVE